jgi:hypothetical protein
MQLMKNGGSRLALNELFGVGEFATNENWSARRGGASTNQSLAKLGQHHRRHLFSFFSRTIDASLGQSKSAHQDANHERPRQAD